MPNIVADAVLDVRGESCPYPFIRTKWLMEQIASGEVLKVIVNDPEALQNIDSWTKKNLETGFRELKMKEICISFM